MMTLTIAARSIVAAVVMPTRLSIPAHVVDDVTCVSASVLASSSPTRLRSAIDRVSSRAGRSFGGSGSLLLKLDGRRFYHCFDLVHRGAELRILEHQGFQSVHQRLCGNKVLLRGGEDSFFVQPRLQDVAPNLPTSGLKLARGQPPTPSVVVLPFLLVVGARRPTGA